MYTYMSWIGCAVRLRRKQRAGRGGAFGGLWGVVGYQACLGCSSLELSRLPTLSGDRTVQPDEVFIMPSARPTGTVRADTYGLMRGHMVGRTVNRSLKIYDCNPLW
jgi:hypothetical protein